MFRVENITVLRRAVIAHLEGGGGGGGDRSTSGCYSQQGEDSKEVDVPTTSLYKDIQEITEMSM